MTAMSFFFISAGVGIWFVKIASVLIVYRVLKVISTAELEVKSIKDNLKLTGLNLISKILGIAKGGEDNGNKK